MTYLSDAEVADICRPLKQPAAQIRFLRRLGYQVERRPDGTPLVLRKGYDAPRPPVNGPRWSSA